METRTRGERQISRRRFTVDDYHRMAEAGILHEDDRVELIEGELADMAPIGARHANCVREFNRLLSEHVGNDLRVDIQNPVRLDERNEPQPDVAVLRARDYRDSLPVPQDVLLLIEVADTSLAYDREVKLPIYARSGIAEVWLVDLNAGVIERHTEPAREGYRLVRRAVRGETLASAVLPELIIPVDALLA